MQLADLEYHHLARELNARLAGQRVQKFYQVTASVFKLKLTRDTLLICLPDYLTITERDIPSPKEPSNFVMAVRKRVLNSVVKGVSQPGFERIIEIALDCKGTACTLVLEMFSDGNILLLGPERIIDVLYRRGEWKDRTLKRGLEYAYPPSKASPLESAPDMISLNGRNTLMAGILSQVSLSPKYLEEALIRAGMDPRSKSEPPQEMRVLIIQKMAEVCSEGKYFLYRDDSDSPAGLSVCVLSKNKGMAYEECDSLSKMIDTLCEPPLSGEAAEERQAEAKSDAIREEMRKRLESLTAEAKFAKMGGDAIYAHYDDVSRAIGFVRESLKRGMGEKEISMAVSKIGGGAGFEFRGGKLLMKIKGDE